MLVASVLCPLLLVAVSLGCGLLVGRLAGGELPTGTVVPVGMATTMVIGSLAALSSATARLAPAAILVAAGSGVLLHRPRRLRRSEARWVAVAALVVFGVYDAPVLATGAPTVTGYIRLDDTASWLALADNLFRHGAAEPALAPSTYQAMMSYYLGSDYPLGGLVPVAFAGSILGTDLVWLWASSVAFMGAAVAGSLYALARAGDLSRGWALAGSTVAACAAALLGYALWGGFKETAAAALLPCLVVFVAPFCREPPSTPRQLVPAVVVTGALLDVLSVGAGVWLAALLPPVVVLGVRAGGVRRVVAPVVTFAGGVVLLGLPSIASSGFLGAPAASHFTEHDRLANLIRPLSPWQLVGIWPARDFRLEASSQPVTAVLIVVAVAACCYGVLRAVREGRPALPLYVSALVAGVLAFEAFASPWVTAKGLAMASPAILIGAVHGCAWLARRVRPRAVGVCAMCVVAGGVAWSAAFAYHGTTIAPHDRFAELAAIGKRFAGQGPTLTTEFEPFAVRYFLRLLDPEGASDLRRRRVPLVSGRLLRTGEAVDLDEIDPAAVTLYRTLVLRRSPLESRPPAAYSLRWRGRFYEVWQRPAAFGPGDLVRHVGLGSRYVREGRLSCARMLPAVQPGQRILVSAPTPTPITVALARTAKPAAWLDDRTDARTIYPASSGTARGEIDVPRRGRYAVWLGGSPQGKAQVLVDGRSVGSVRQELSHGQQYTLLGSVALAQGGHAFALRLTTDLLHPGAGAESYGLGPVLLQRLPATPRVRDLTDAGRADLCGRAFDWLEVVG